MIDVVLIRKQLDWEHDYCVEQDLTTPETLAIAYRLLEELEASRALIESYRHMLSKERGPR